MTPEESSSPGEQTLSSLHPLEVAVLTDLHTQSPANEADLAIHTGLDPAQVSMSIGWLQAKSSVTLSHRVDFIYFDLLR